VAGQNKKKLAYLDARLAWYLDEIKTAQAQVWELAADRLEALVVSKGIVLPRTENLTVASGVIADARLFIEETQYDEVAAAFVEEWADGPLPQYALDQVASFGLAVESSEYLADVIEAYQKVALQRLIHAGDLAADELGRGVLEGVVGGRSFREWEKDLKGVIVGTDIKGGSLQRYSYTYANTAQATFDRTLNNAVMEEAGVEKVEYVGPVDGATRDWCARHVGKVYTIEEAKQLTNDQGGSAFVEGGGYNCRHEWAAVE
jgi:hypothetical protein